MPRVAEENPAACAVCYCANPGRYVDFDAQSDRGYYAEGTDHPVPLDWIIICESCMAEAARCIDFEPTSDREQKVRDLEVKLDVLTRERDQAVRYSGSLEDAFENRPEPIKLDH